MERNPYIDARNSARATACGWCDNKLRDTHVREDVDVAARPYKVKMPSSSITPRLFDGIQAVRAYGDSRGNAAVHVWVDWKPKLFPALEKVHCGKVISL